MVCGWLFVGLFICYVILYNILLLVRVVDILMLSLNVFLLYVY